MFILRSQNILAERKISAAEGGKDPAKMILVR